MLAVVSAVPPLALAGWLLAGLPSLLLGWFRPALMVPLGIAVAALLCWYGLRRQPETVPATAFQTAAVGAIAVASGVFNGFFRTEQLIVRRDPATYAQYAIWLAEHGTLPIPREVAAFGGPDPALRFDSMGFFDFGGAVVPQFMAGPPVIHAVGHWLGGMGGLLLMPPVLGALAVLTFSGVVARLVGARWAPLAALAFAVSMPILYTSRTTYSEIPSLILLFGGMTLLLDARFRLRAGVLGVGFLPSARAAQSGGAALTAGLAGLVFGLALLVRIDGLRDILPVLAYAGLLIALTRLRPTRRSPEAGGVPGPGAAPDGRLGVPLLIGLAVGAGWGFTAGYVLARPYLGYLSGSLQPLLAICALVLVLTITGTALAPRIAGLFANRFSASARPGSNPVAHAAGRRSGRPSGPSGQAGDRSEAGGAPGQAGGRTITRRLPDLAAGLVVLVMVGFAVRPWLQTVRREPLSPEDELTAKFIEKTQIAGHLPIDRTRLYYEDSLYWVIWYVGLPVVVLATLAAAVQVRRLARGREFGWLLPLTIIAWTTVTTLWRPAITPDQPFASRRLVPIVIPGLILLAVWGLRWVRDRARRSGYGSRLPVVAGAVLLLVPGLITSIGTAFSPVDRGEADAVARLCAAIPRDASALIVERVTGDRLTQVVRGQCGVPAARVKYPQGSDVPAEADVRRLISTVRSTGRRPVLLAAEERQLSPYGAATPVMRLRTRQDERSLISPPDGTWSLSIDVWLATPFGPR